MFLRKVLWMAGLLSLGFVQCCAADETAAVAQPVPATKEGTTEIFMVDGPGMMNPNLGKHKELDGGWMAPEGDLALEIKGFDYKFGIYKAGEPDNFRWLEDRFYFDGGEGAKDRDSRFSLMLNGEPTIKDTEGNTLVTIVKMWHEKKSIYMELKYPNGLVKRELRKFEDIKE